MSKTYRTLPDVLEDFLILGSTLNILFSANLLLIPLCMVYAYEAVKFLETLVQKELCHTKCNVAIQMRPNI